MQYEKGVNISGISNFTNTNLDNGETKLFHAGSKLKNGEWENIGGRVLYVTAIGNNMNKVKDQVYSDIKKIKFNGMHYRTDIGKDETF